MENEKYIKMTETPVQKLVCTLAVPAIISMLITAIYNMADTYFVGKVGTSATAAVGVAFPLMSIIQAISFFFGHGSGNFISRKLGAGEEDEAFKMGSSGFFLAFLTLSLIGVVCFIFIKPLSILLGASETMLPHTVKYITYILIGAPFIGCSYVLNNILRFQGNAFYGMIGMSTGAILNIVLDPILIFGFNMGASGAGLATLIGQIIGCVVLLYLNNKKSIVKISFKHIKITFGILREIVRGGIPSLCRQGLAAVATMALNNFAVVHGDAAIAAMSIVGRIGMMALSTVIGIGQGFQPVCGFNYGAKKYDRVKKAFWFSNTISTVFLIVVGIFGYIFANDFIKIFRDDLKVIEIGAFALKMQCIVLPLLGFNCISNMFLQTIGKPIPATLVAMSRQFLFFIPALIILNSTIGLLGIQLTQAVSDLLAFLFTIPLTVTVLKRIK